MNPKYCFSFTLLLPCLLLVLNPVLQTQAKAGYSNFEGDADGTQLVPVKRNVAGHPFGASATRGNGAESDAARKKRCMEGGCDDDGLEPGITTGTKPFPIRPGFGNNGGGNNGDGGGGSGSGGGITCQCTCDGLPIDADPGSGMKMKG